MEGASNRDSNATLAKVLATIEETVTATTATAQTVLRAVDVLPAGDPRQAASGDARAAIAGAAQAEALAAAGDIQRALPYLTEAVTLATAAHAAVFDAPAGTAAQASSRPPVSWGEPDVDAKVAAGAHAAPARKRPTPAPGHAAQRNDRVPVDQSLPKTPEASAKPEPVDTQASQNIDPDSPIALLASLPSLQAANDMILTVRKAKAVLVATGLVPADFADVPVAQPMPQPIPQQQAAQPPSAPAPSVKRAAHAKVASEPVESEAAPAPRRENPFDPSRIKAWLKDAPALSSFAALSAPKRKRIAAIAAACMVLVALVGSIGWGIANLPGAAEGYPDPNAQEGTVEVEATPPADPQDFKLVLNQAIELKAGSRDLDIEFENLESNGYDARLAIGLDGKAIASSGMVAPGETVDTLAITRDLDPGEYEMLAVVTVYSDREPVNTLSADVIVRVS